jgi:UDP-N-acetylglucosamine 2-epimerase (non-hydrolysing)
MKDRSIFRDATLQRYTQMSKKALKIMSVVGARPNFMKIAPFVRAIEAHNENLRQGACSIRDAMEIDHFLVHTGQHYDREMSHAFFEALEIPAPDVDLGVGSGSHAEQVGRTMVEFEKILRKQTPDWVVVVGDVNATAACTITAKKCHVQVAHIEAGLRSFDRSMPEEINRIVTDSIADLLLTPDAIADENLRREGHAEETIQFVGNIMIDTLETHRDRAAVLDLNNIMRSHAIAPEIRGLGAKGSGQRSEVDDLRENAFSLLTLHRPSNVDDRDVLTPLVRLLMDEISVEMPLVWSIHPRTRKNLERFDLWNDVVNAMNIRAILPVSYHEMLKLTMSARLVLTDSGGLQEESCVLGTPCVTLREHTERPVTLLENGGVSILAGTDPHRIRSAFQAALRLERRGHTPPLWDGHTAERVIHVLFRVSQDIREKLEDYNEEKEKVATQSA